MGGRVAGRVGACRPRRSLSPAGPRQGRRARRAAGGGTMTSLAEFPARHLRLEVAEGIATITLDRPERKNPLTFDSYAELSRLFRDAVQDDAVRAFVITGAGGNFCSGGDVHEIIGPLLERDSRGLLAFTAMTGDLVKAMRACPQPIIAAVDGVAA